MFFALHQEYKTRRRSLRTLSPLLNQSSAKCDPQCRPRPGSWRCGREAVAHASSGSWFWQIYKVFRDEPTLPGRDLTIGTKASTQQLIINYFWQKIVPKKEIDEKGIKIYYCKVLVSWGVPEVWSTNNLSIELDPITRNPCGIVGYCIAR